MFSFEVVLDFALLMFIAVAAFDTFVLEDKLEEHEFCGPVINVCATILIICVVVKCGMHLFM